jgi:hypothetical protein
MSSNAPFNAFTNPHPSRAQPPPNTTVCAGCGNDTTICSSYDRIMWDNTPPGPARRGGPDPWNDLGYCQTLGCNHLATLHEFFTEEEDKLRPRCELCLSPHQIPVQHSYEHEPRRYSDRDTCAGCSKTTCTASSEEETMLAYGKCSTPGCRHNATIQHRLSASQSYKLPMGTHCQDKRFQFQSETLDNFPYNINPCTGCGDPRCNILLDKESHRTYGKCKKPGCKHPAIRHIHYHEEDDVKFARCGLCLAYNAPDLTRRTNYPFLDYSRCTGCQSVICKAHIRESGGITAA